MTTPAIPDGPVPLEVTFIYVLKDPETGEVRYVGKASKPSKRLTQHLRDARRLTDHKAVWIRSLLQRGLKPEVEIVDEVPMIYWQALEAAYIAFYRELGSALVNTTPGGDGFGSGALHPSFGKKFSPQHAAKHKAAFTPAVRERMSLTRRGKDFVSREARERLRQLNIGRKMPEAQRAALSACRAANLGKKASAETRAKLSLVRMGHGCSAETRARISAAYTAQRKADLRARLTGKTRAPEIGRKISATKRAKREPLQLQLL